MSESKSEPQEPSATPNTLERLLDRWLDRAFRACADVSGMPGAWKCGLCPRCGCTPWAHAWRQAADELVAALRPSEGPETPAAAPAPPAVPTFLFTCRECGNEQSHRFVLVGPTRILVQCMACADTQCVYEQAAPAPAQAEGWQPERCSAMTDIHGRCVLNVGHKGHHRNVSEDAFEYAILGPRG